MLPTSRLAEDVGRILALRSASTEKQMLRIALTADPFLVLLGL
jgi:hypothetical protein